MATPALQGPEGLGLEACPTIQTEFVHVVLCFQMRGFGSAWISGRLSLKSVSEIQAPTFVYINI